MTPNVCDSCGDSDRFCTQITSLNEGCPADDARQAAITLIDAAMAGE